jgi:hypothetical protein
VPQCCHDNTQSRPPRFQFGIGHDLPLQYTSLDDCGREKDHKPCYCWFIWPLSDCFGCFKSPRQESNSVP